MIKFLKWAIVRMIATVIVVADTICIVVADAIYYRVTKHPKPKPEGADPIAHSLGISVNEKYELMPDIFGWRAWYWSVINKKLYSPYQGTTWDGSELRCDWWERSDVLRGCAGIHAYRAPVRWREAVRIPLLTYPYASLGITDNDLDVIVPVHGIAERAGKYVLGEDGWRAEWVIVRSLVAPTEEIGLQIEVALPGVEVVYG